MSPARVRADADAEFQHVVIEDHEVPERLRRVADDALALALADHGIEGVEVRWYRRFIGPEPPGVVFGTDVRLRGFVLPGLPWLVYVDRDTDARQLADTVLHEVAHLAALRRDGYPIDPDADEAAADAYALGWGGFIEVLAHRQPEGSS